MKSAIGLALALVVATPAFAADVEKLRRERGTMLPDGVIQFDQGASAFGPIYKEGVERIAQDLARRSSKESVLIVGHTDDVGLPQTNQRLLLARAAAVRTALVAKGVPEHMLSVLGVGATEPVDPSLTEEARARNRRVEFWLTNNKAVAHVTWIQRSVDAQEGGGVSWSPAALHMPLMKLFKVRTGDESSSEVTFRQENKLFLQSNALVVIYDSTNTSRSRSRVADVTLEEGSLVARLAKSSEPIRVDSPAAQVELRSKRARIGYDRREKTQRVAVYDGSAKVAAQGRTVTVPKGQGTRVKKGRQPERPRALPRAPTWISKDPVILYAGSFTEIKWNLTARTSTVEVEFADADDEAFERPIRETRVTGSSAKISEMPLGAYRIRLSSIDQRGLVGNPGPPLRLLVIRPPLGTTGQPLDVRDGLVELPAPGFIRQPAPEGVVIKLGSKADPAPPSGLPLPVPGRYTVPFRVSLLDGTGFGGGVLLVVVRSAQLVVPELAPEVLGEQSSTPVRFQIVGSDDSPVLGLKFRANRTGTPLPELAPLRRQKDGNRRGDLGRCKCESPAGAVDVAEEGGGYYSFRWNRPAGNGYSTDIVRLLEAESLMVQEIRVPIGAVKPFVAETVESGFVAAIRAGGQLADDNKPNVHFGVELGGRLHLLGPLSVDLGAYAGFFRTGVRVVNSTPEAANVIPLYGRGALALNIEPVVLYAGAGAGLHVVVSPFDEAHQRGTIKPIQFGLSVLGGLGVIVGPGELHLEFSWPLTRLDVEGDITANLGPALTLGYRWTPWVDPSEEIIEERDVGPVGDIDVQPDIVDF